jgi:glycosyltransferase involved in cell wall biosynthesis
MNEMVSIVVPVYNGEDLILETLESVRLQQYSPIELIVVDDASSDRTASVVSEWVRSHNVENCTLISLEKNLGKSSAVNAAFNLFRGEYIMVLDSDDVLLPDAIGEEVRFLTQHQDVGMVFARAYAMKGITKTNSVLGGFRDSDDFSDLQQRYGDLLLKGNAIIASTVLMRCEVVKNVGQLNERLRYTHDWEYWIRVAKTTRIGFLSRVVLYYRTQLASSSMNRLGTFRETVSLLHGATATTKRTALLKALVYQIKYHLWLSYHDGDPLQMARIAISGLRSFAACLFWSCGHG